MDALAPTHLILIAMAALVLFFGWRQLPEMARSLGRSMNVFKTELNGSRAPSTSAATTQAAETLTSSAPAAADTREETLDAA